MRLDGLDAKSKTAKIHSSFLDQLNEYGRKGLFGVAKFSEVFSALIPVQQNRLRLICEEMFDILYSHGSVISIAIAYDEEFIKKIYLKSNGILDITTWNLYADEYDVINSTLNTISKELAEAVGGTALTATWENKESKDFEYISETFGDTVSHRVAAEIAGLGWRGKSGLVINEEFSSAIRFASILVPFVIDYSQKSSMDCGNCNACEEACSFIRNRSILNDYRDNCMRYINYLMSLGLKYDVCGKCIKACYFESIYSNQFQL